MGKPERIYHTWDKWECYPAGFYGTTAGMPEDDAKREYVGVLANRDRLAGAIARVVAEWPRSCEHYLTNARMNRLSWICQAAVCLETGLPSCYWPVFFTLPQDRQEAAFDLALSALNGWMTARGYDSMTKEEAGINAKVNLY